MPRMHSHCATEHPAGLAATYWLKRPAVPPLAWSSPVMITAALRPRGKYQNRGSGFLSAVSTPIRLTSSRCCSSACGIATLLRSTQFGCGSNEAGPKNMSSRPDRRGPVALLAGPRRVALARVHDRPGEVVGERRGAAAVGADAAHRDRGRGRRRRRVRVQVGDAGRAVERVAVGRPVELHRLRHDPGAGLPRGVDAHVRVGQRGAGVGQPEQPGELLVRAHRDEVAAAGDPVAQHRHLARGEREVAEDRDVVSRPAWWT